MTREDILQRLVPVFVDVFEDDAIDVHAALSAHDVERWDSIANIRLFLAIEEEFGVRFDAVESTTAANVGEIADLIIAKA